MGLTPSTECSDCLGQVDGSAIICLHCGAVQTERRTWVSWYWAGGALVLLAAAVWVVSGPQISQWLVAGGVCVLSTGIVAQVRSRQRPEEPGRWYCRGCETWLDRPYDHFEELRSLHPIKWYSVLSGDRPPRPGDRYCNDCDEWVLQGEAHFLGHDLELWRIA